MSRLCWYGLPTPLPLAMVYELHPHPTAAVPSASYGTRRHKPGEARDQPWAQ